MYRIRAPGSNNGGQGPGIYTLKNGRRASKTVDSPALVIEVRG
jgi:hypothetical protein